MLHRALVCLFVAGCGTASVADAPRPPPGPPPSGTVGANGGDVERLWFAVTGDTRPGSCDATDEYPSATIAQLARSMKSLQVQFALDLGDHMYVCNGSDPEARQQMSFYMTAIAGGPATWFMTMGNHECGAFTCAPGTRDANFGAYMAALGRPLPYYALDVRTRLGVARIIVIADDAWDAAQAAWLEATLAAPAQTVIVARHHPVTGTRTGNSGILSTLGAHHASLILAAHDHVYAHDATAWGGRSAIVGLGGAPSRSPPGFGTVLQNVDGSLTFVLRDAFGDPVGEAWTVSP